MRQAVTQKVGDRGEGSCGWLLGAVVRGPRLVPPVLEP